MEKYAFLINQHFQGLVRQRIQQAVFQLTAEAVKQHLTDIVADDITRYELPNLPALYFVRQQALMGGVTTSLTIDTHGKSLSYTLLEMWMSV